MERLEALSLERPRVACCLPSAARCPPAIRHSRQEAVEDSRARAFLRKYQPINKKPTIASQLFYRVSGYSCFVPSGILASLSENTVASCFLVTLAPHRLASLRSAPLRLAPLRSVSLRSAFVRSASSKSVSFR